MYYPFFVFIILHLIPSVFGTLDVIPLIDIQAWTAEENGLSENHDDKSREEVAKMIGRACEESGFFAIKNHGVNDTIMQNMWESSRQFFDLPLGEKLKSKTSNESEYPYGYEKSETLVVGKRLDGTMEGTMEEEEFPPDLKETFSLGPDNPLAGMPPRRYPKKPPQMKDALASYYHEMEKLADLLLRIFAIALDLPKTWFEDKMDKHMSALRILNYFEVGNSDYKPQQLRAGAHTDYGALTILKSGGPGLQVMSRGQWVDVPYLPHENTFVINIADLMSRWTNGKYTGGISIERVNAFFLC